MSHEFLILADTGGRTFLSKAFLEMGLDDLDVDYEDGRRRRRGRSLYLALFGDR